MLWFLQIVRVLMLAGGINSGIFSIIYLAMLLIPSAIAIIMPMLFAFAVFFVFFSMIQNGELIAMKSFGLSDKKILKPLLQSGLFFMIFYFVFSSIISPYCQTKFRKVNNIIQAQYALSVLKKQSFIS